MHILRDIRKKESPRRDSQSGRRLIQTEPLLPSLLAMIAPTAALMRANPESFSVLRVALRILPFGFCSSTISSRFRRNFMVLSPFGWFPIIQDVILARIKRKTLYYESFSWFSRLLSTDHERRFDLSSRPAALRANMITNISVVRVVLSIRLSLRSFRTSLSILVSFVWTVPL
jgi:hypothetical protein